MSQGVSAFIAPQEPSTWDVYQHLQQRGDRRRLEQEQRKKESEAHENSLLQYMTKQWDDKELDGLLQDQYGQKVKEYTDMIRKNPKMSMVDLATMMQGDLSNISNWNKTIKQGKSLIDQQGADYKGVDNIKHNRATQIAIENMLFDKDEKGNKVLRKSYKDIDLTKNYFEDALDQFPDELLKNKPTVEAILKGAPTSKLGDVYKVTKPSGASVNKQFNAEIYPFQEIYDDAEGEKQVRTKGEEIIPGKPEKMATKENYDWFTSKRDQRMFVNSEFKKYVAAQVAQGKKPIDPASPEADIIKRKIVYDLLDDKQTPKNIQRILQQKDAPAPKTTTTVIIDGKEKDATIPITRNTVLSGALRSGEYDDQAPDVDVAQPGGKLKRHKDILPVLGGSVKVVHPKGGRAVSPTAILYDPAQRAHGYYVYYNEKEGDQMVEKKFRVVPSQLKNWMLSSSRANSEGGNFTRSDADVNRHFDANGKPIAPIQKVVDNIKRRITVRK